MVFNSAFKGLISH